MSILDKIEKRFSFLGFNNLNLYITAIFLVGLVINFINPIYYYYYLSLNVNKILTGEVWRLFTFVFYPPSSGNSIILSLLMIYIYYSISKTLIFMWGNFKFNIYLLIGYFSQILGAFIIYFVMKENVVLYPVYNTFSIIMAFALTFPDSYFMIYFIIPLKAKYFAYFEIALYIFRFVFSGLTDRIAIICSAINVFIFFVLIKKKGRYE